jgi:hypothetical protein
MVYFKQNPFNNTGDNVLRMFLKRRFKKLQKMCYKYVNFMIGCLVSHF